MLALNAEEKIALFREMVSCCHNLYMWTYDAAFRLTGSNCPEPEAMHNIFMMACGQDGFNEELAARDTPALLTNDVSMMWLAFPQFEQGAMVRSRVLGPFFVDDISCQNINVFLLRKGMSSVLRKCVLEFLNQLPVIAWSRVQEYGIMLHYCLTGEKIHASDLRYWRNPADAATHESSIPTVDAHGTYQAEKEMLRMVREGDLNLESYINRIAVVGSVGRLSNGDQLRQMKNQSIVCATLFSRAAIEGGLSPELSYTLTDHYCQGIEACNNVSEITELTYGMQKDFVERVHRCRLNKYPPAIQAVCDYISLHLEEEITIAMLARHTGYADYYFSKKFKKETGLIPAEYIRRRRLERAAFRLRTTNEEIQAISSRLQFCSQSYFTDSFRKYYGVSPGVYRLNPVEPPS